MSIQFDLFVPPDLYRDKVISEEPYVKVLGDIGWSHDYQCLTALAQVESCLCIVSFKMSESPSPARKLAYPA
jgi:hypothetical protein